MGRRLLVGVAGLLLVLAGCTSSSGDSTTTTGPSTAPASLPSSSVPSSTTTTTLDPVVVAVSETFELLAVSPLDAVVPGLVDAVDTEVALPAGAVFIPVLDTVRVDGSIAEVVAEVVLADGTVDRFGVVMIADGDRWLIAYTVKAP